MIWKENQIEDDLSNIGVALDGEDLLFQASTHQMHPML